MTQDFVQDVLEPEIILVAELGYEEVHHPEWFEAHAGMDESGKGDLFGPVICATVIADGDMVRQWMDAGIKDSKKISDGQIVRLEKVILKTKGVVVEKSLLRYESLQRTHEPAPGQPEQAHCLAACQGTREGVG